MTHGREWRADHSSLVSNGLGPVVVRRYGGVSLRLWRRAMVLTVDLWLVLSVVRMIVGSREHFVREVGVLFFVAAAIVGVLALGAVLAARRRRYDIHRHGLVLRGRRGKQVAAIPWTTLDPGRILISTPPRRVQVWTPRGLLDWAARPTVVLINGWVDRPNDLEHGQPHRYDIEAIDSPFGWWQLGVTDPASLLAAIESAMVADERPARGLTAAALSQRYDAGPATQGAVRELERGSADSVVGIVQSEPETCDRRRSVAGGTLKARKKNQQ